MDYMLLIWTTVLAFVIGFFLGWITFYLRTKDRYYIAGQLHVMNDGGDILFMLGSDLSKEELASDNKRYILLEVIHTDIQESA